MLLTSPACTAQGSDQSDFSHSKSLCVKLRTLALLAFVLSAPFEATAQVQSLVAGNTAFALNLYGPLASSQSNLFFSPYSISTALAMTYVGARGQTQAQMSQTLGFGTNVDQLASTFAQLQAELEADQQLNAITLDIANALWIAEGHPFLASFLQTATNQFQAAVNQADFVNDADAVTQDINNWVAQNTQGKIQNIVAPGVIDPTTVLVLANAIYFLGSWTESFDLTNTAIEGFNISSTTNVPVAMMHQPAPAYGSNGFTGIRFNYMQSNNFQAIEIPYASNQISMLILLPSQVDGLGQLEQQLSPAFLSGVLAQMTPQIVDLSLPRFTLESFFDLPKTLAQMGMPDAFSATADFSGIDGWPDLFISHVLHKAWLQVNETGTQAAAATVVVGTGTVGPQGPPNPVFRANHPFLFFIRDTQSGSLLFAGQLANPGPPPPPPSAPQLTMNLSANSLRISWPYPSPGWALQQNADLTTTNWSPSAEVSNDGTNSFLTIKASGNCMFFRLSPQ
jgi:serpin B